MLLLAATDFLFFFQWLNTYSENVFLMILNLMSWFHVMCLYDLIRHRTNAQALFEPREKAKKQ